MRHRHHLPPTESSPRSTVVRWMSSVILSPFEGPTARCVRPFLRWTAAVSYNHGDESLIPHLHCCPGDGLGVMGKKGSRKELGRERDKRTKQVHRLHARIE